jgi:hypothetical protein
VLVIRQLSRFELHGPAVDGDFGQIPL